MKANWLVNPFQDNDIEKSILRGRGITNYEKFLYPTLDRLNNPFLLADAVKAAKRIISAVDNNEKIFIFGHDDVDGVTSTVILHTYLTHIGSSNHFYYIPNREFERYGIQKSFIDKVLKERPKLIVTVDSGINEIDAVDFFNRHNIDTVVLDHHIIYQRLPRAVAVVNPKRKDCPPEGNLPRHDKFPFNMLAGVGVVYNVIKIIEQFKKIPPNNLYPALVGLGTIADRMPLIDDNRIFAKFTFENILDSENLFISFFVEHNKNLSRSKMIDLLIKLLTMGRDRDGLHLGVEALLANRLSEVKEEYDILQTRLEKNIKEFGKVNEFIEAKFNEGLALGVNGKESEDIFIYCDKKGYIPIKFLGKAASYLFDKYKIPTLILTRQGNNVLSAESRGPENFDWLDSFGKISEHLIQYGGHKRAAGFTCYDREFEKIRDKLIQIAKANSDMHQAEHSKKGEIKIDYQIAKENLNVKGLEGIFNLFSPFGEGNKLPIFLVDNISCCELKSLGIDNIPQIKEEEKVDALISFNNRKQKALRILDYEIRD